MCPVVEPYTEGDLLISAAARQFLQVEGEAQKHVAVHCAPAPAPTDGPGQYVAEGPPQGGTGDAVVHRVPSPLGHHAVEGDQVRGGQYVVVVAVPGVPVSRVRVRHVPFPCLTVPCVLVPRVVPVSSIVLPLRVVLVVPHVPFPFDVLCQGRPFRSVARPGSGATQSSTQSSGSVNRAARRSPAGETTVMRL